MASTFLVKGTWAGDRNSTGTITTNGLHTEISVPKELDGPGIGANPEEFLISAATNCYMITLAAILSNRGIEYSHMEVESEGTVLKEGNRLRFEKIVHKPVIFVRQLGQEQLEQLEKLAHRAEKACFISQTLKGSVEISVEPEIRIFE